jgi:hypothetical protein
VKRSEKKWAHRDLANPKHKAAIAQRLARAEADAAAKKLPKPKRAEKAAPKKPPTHPARTARKRNDLRKATSRARAEAARIRDEQRRAAR